MEQNKKDDGCFFEKAVQRTYSIFGGLLLSSLSTTVYQIKVNTKSDRFIGRGLTCNTQSESP